MQATTRFSFPILTEVLPVRTPDDPSVEELDADVGLGLLEIFPDRDTFTITQQDLLASTPADEMDPRLMNGGRVAYLSDAHGHSALYLREADGHAQAIAPSVEVTDHMPSPDGKHLVLCQF
jgi:hypothetical protein